MTIWVPGHRSARVADAATGRRHAAGSPDPAEVACYAAALPAQLDGGVLVLGGTPELRMLASERAARSIAIDRDPDAGRLDTDSLLAELDETHAAGAIDDHQHTCIGRYRVGGTTSLLRQGRWEAVLREAGWSCERRELSGRWWYGWYAVHVCAPPLRSATAPCS